MVALASHIPHNLCLGQNLWHFWEATDVMFSLLFGLIALTAWNSRAIPALWQKMAVIAICCLLAYSADWNYVAVLWILGFGIFHGNIRGQLLAFTLVTGIYLVQPFIYGSSLPYISRFGVFLAMPLLRLYSGSRGKRNKWIQWGFYWFYPVHFLVIYCVSRVF